MRSSTDFHEHMSKMAKCLRLALSASSKYLQSHGGLSVAHKSLLRLPTCHAVRNSQLSTAAITSFTRRSSPVLSPAVKSCTCEPSRRQMQTDVDKELLKFLDNEIKFEEKQGSKSRLQVKGIQGFHVTADDAEVTLTKTTGSETVKVKFSINASVDSSSSMQPDDKDTDPEMVSQPPFSVEICKGDGQTLTMHCSFVSPEDLEQEGGQQDAETIVDTFEIQEVALHKGEWKETVYSVQADIMDGNLYDLLMDMLDTRGINDEFANQLMDFSTSYEHNRYVSFLKDLKKFVEK